ncbi:M48 family metallopeptidase [Clostridium sp. MB05]|uniref:M48 family metallopeptidase n=1 Tax=Clostridium sp. MB05 TaxID=3376682 RepID=UPI0039826B18
MNNYKDIEYELIRRKRKIPSLIVEAGGAVKLIVPESFTIEDVEKILENKLYWIYTKRSEFEDLNNSKVNRQFRSGQGFLYLGSSYRLEVTENTDKDLKLYRGRFYLKKTKISEGRELFKVFYKEKGMKKVEQIVEKYRKQMGVKTKNIRIMELQNRWGSCSDEGNLNFHWKSLMAPLSIIEYIVVHELAHLISKNHNEEFWNTIDKVMPDYEKRKKWLRDNGASLDI